MARQNIGTGSSANDGTGDTLRTAGTKINDNFKELYQFLGSDNNTLSAQITLEDSAVVFEGATADAFETRLTASNVESDVLIRLPDSDGTIILDNATQTLTNKNATFTQLAAAMTLVSSNQDIGDSNTNPFVNFVDSGNSALALSLSDGTNNGQLRFFTNNCGSNAVIDVKNGDNFTLSSAQNTMCIWTGTAWEQLYTN